MSVPYISPERKQREHEEILAYIARENAEKERLRQEQEAREKEEQEFLEWIGELPPEMQPKPRFEETLKASDFADKSQSPFTKGNQHYQININHSAIRPIYDQYVQEECKGIRPITDHQRIFFEMRVIHRLNTLHIFKDDYIRPLTDQEIRNLKYQAIRERERLDRGFHR